MPFIIKVKNILLGLPLLSIPFLFLSVPVQAAEIIKLGNLQNLLDSVYETIRSLAPVVAVIIIAILGFQLISAGDDANVKARIRNTFVALIIGLALLYGAQPLVNSLISSVK